jgi:hypothetical protein
LNEVRSRADQVRPFIEPVLIILIGLALGLVNQTASEVPGAMRGPALIAALILVGQGINLLDAARKGDEIDVTTPDEVSVGSGRVPPRGHASDEINLGEDTELDDEEGGSGMLPWLVLGLAIWLGLATLAYPTAPLSLTLLSLLAAYLLFARGWKLMAPTSRR